MSNELIFNPYIPQKDDEEPRRSPRNEATRTHSLRTLVPHRKKFSGSKMVNLRIDYPQAMCRSCKKKVRTYCMCSPGVLQCNDCFAQHVFDAETGSDKQGLTPVSQNSSPRGTFEPLFSP
jgi:hypothetical protein